MILNQSSSTLEKSENFQSKQFTIKADKIFRIILDGIYSDVYGSIVREITSNAIDATTEVGSSKNVEVTFVDKDELSGQDYQLIIKDYGVGINQDRMYDIFCNLGQSTKDLDNSQIGGFGIGSKSPFKYTDTYTVKTISNGVEYLYIMVINADDIPECNLIYETPTDQENGTEIIIPIKNKSDYDYFKEACEDQLLWFDNITFNNVEVTKPVILYEDSEIIIVDKSVDRPILIGKVPYKSVNSSRVIYKFNIGELQPTASREAIDNSKIINGLKVEEIIENKKKEAFKSIEKYLENTKNTDIFKFYQEYSKLTGESLKGVNIENSGGLTYDILTDFKITSYSKRYWRSTCDVHRSNINSVLSSSHDKIYYNDVNIVSETAIKQYVVQSKQRVDKLDPSTPKFIFDELVRLGYAVPLSTIIQPKVRASRKTDKTTVKVTRLSAKEVITMSVDDFTNEYLNLTKPVLYTLDSGISQYSNIHNWGYCFRIESSQLNKLPMSDSLIHYQDVNKIFKYLLKNNKSFIKVAAYYITIENDKKKEEIVNNCTHYSSTRYYLGRLFNKYTSNSDISYPHAPKEFFRRDRVFLQNLYKEFPELLIHVKKLSTALKAYQRLVDKNLIINP